MPVRGHRACTARPQRIIAEPEKRASAEPADQRKAGLAEMHALAQRIAAFEIAREALAQARGSRRSPAPSRTSSIWRDERRAVAPRVRSCGAASSASAPRKRGRRLRRVQHLHRRAMRGKRIERQVDAIEAR